MKVLPFIIHSGADVSEQAKIGEGTLVWHQAQIREGASIGKNCIIGKGAYVDKGVKIGSYCKLQNYCCIYHGAIIEDDVFIGPGVLILNDKYPRATTTDGKLQSDKDWVELGVHIAQGASIGAGAIILPGVKIGKHAMIGAGSVVSKDVPEHCLAYGNPARIMKKI